jgi:photosystem II stability/assembly factor-like uncharacterized protein
MKRLLVLIWLLSVISVSPAQKPLWKRLNGPYGSPALAIACDSNNNLYAATDDSLYHSEDGGQHWRRIGHEFKNCKLQEIAVGDDNTVYLAACNGLHLSKDAGETWTNIPSITYAKEVQTSSNGLVCVIGAGEATSDLGLFISQDSGKTWTQPFADLHVAFEYEHVLSIGVNGEIYAVNKSSLGLGRLNMFRSFDKGLHWDTIDVIGQITMDSTILEPAREQQSRLTVARNGQLYWSFKVKQSNTYPFTSLDSGKSWSLLHEFDVSDSALPPFSHYITGYRGEIYGLDASGSRGFYSLYLTNDKQLKRLQDINAYIYSATIDRSGRVYIATDAGIYFYNEKDLLVGAGTNNAKVWRILADKQGNLVASIYQQTDLSGAGWSHKGYLAYSTDEGITWLPASTPRDAFVTDIAQDSLGRVFVCVPDDRQYYYFNPDTRTLSKYGGMNGDTGLIAVGSSGIIYKSSGYYQNWDIHVSVDTGQTWQRVSSGLKQRVFSICTSVNGFVFVGTANAVYRLKEGDTTWTRCYNQFLGSPVVALHSTREGVVYAGSSAQGIYLSTDNGDSWKQINNGLTNLTVSAICSDPQGNIYTATKNGVFQSVGSSDWESINHGIDVPDVRDLTVSNKGILYAATHGGGVYQFLPNVNYVDAEEHPSTLDVSVVTNPFSDKIVLHIHSPTSQSLQLDIHDALGRQVFSEELRYQNINEYSYQVEAKNWAAGVYFGRITNSWGEAVTATLIKQ